MRSRTRARSFVRMGALPALGGRHASFVLIGLSILSLMVYIARPAAFSGARVGAIDTFSPVLSAVSAPILALSGFVGDVSGLASLRTQNEILRQENLRLRAWYQSALTLQAENDSLRDLLNVRTDPARRFRTARVIGDTGNAYVKSLLIESGRRDGVEKGQSVLSGEGLVGRTIDVGVSSARVLLLTDVNSRIPVLIEGSGQRAVLAGMNDQLPVLLYMPQDHLEPEGVRVVTSGHGGIFPAGLPVGRVVILPDGVQAVRPFADFDRLVHVRILDLIEDPNFYPAP